MNAGPELAKSYSEYSSLTRNLESRSFVNLPKRGMTMIEKPILVDSLDQR